MMSAIFVTGGGGFLGALLPAVCRNCLCGTDFAVLRPSNGGGRA
jgi:hypothetical protein